MDSAQSECDKIAANIQKRTWDMEEQECEKHLEEITAGNEKMRSTSDSDESLLWRTHSWISLHTHIREAKKDR